MFGEGGEFKSWQAHGNKLPFLHFNEKRVGEYLMWSVSYSYHYIKGRGRHMKEFHGFWSESILLSLGFWEVIFLLFLGFLGFLVWV